MFKTLKVCFYSKKKKH